MAFVAFKPKPGLPVFNQLNTLSPIELLVCPRCPHRWFSIQLISYSTPLRFFNFLTNFTDLLLPNTSAFSLQRRSWRIVPMVPFTFSPLILFFFFLLPSIQTIIRSKDFPPAKINLDSRDFTFLFSPYEFYYTNRNYTIDRIKARFNDLNRYNSFSMKTLN